MTMEGVTMLVDPRPLPNFVETPFVQGIVDRALTYLAAGFPVHLRGAAGTGKTTLAMHVASKLGRPVILLHGDEESSSSDLVGGEQGYHMHKVIDNFIHSVLKTEEDVTSQWVDNRLTVACRYGFTLVYDEFTRSRPEANNVLLSVLQEKMLDLSSNGNGDQYLRVHPDFNAIFTSNPEEYAGVYRTQDALRDRMVTLDLDLFDEETEVAITQAKSGLDRRDAEAIVRIARGLRESGACETGPTVRACIIVARAMKVRGVAFDSRDSQFRQICSDVLASGSSRAGPQGQLPRARKVLDELLHRHGWVSA